MKLIDEQAAIAAIHREIYKFFDICEDDEESPMTYKDMRLLELNKSITKRLKDLPAVDAVPVVRCKDCRFADAYYHCVYTNFWESAEDYCSRGEKKYG